MIGFTSNSLAYALQKWEASTVSQKFNLPTLRERRQKQLHLDEAIYDLRAKEKIIYRLSRSNLKNFCNFECSTSPAAAPGSKERSAQCTCSCTSMFGTCLNTTAMVWRVHGKGEALGASKYITSSPLHWGDVTKSKSCAKSSH